MIATGGLVDIARGLREAFLMLWQIFWALGLGFAISGILQSFVPKRRVERLLGNHRPAALLRAAGFGMASSSCSYAASALARRLYRLGADLISSLVFMVASTNLVIELGIVLAVLIGWQFVLGEFVGGGAMIVVIAVIGMGLLSSRAVARATLTGVDDDRAVDSATVDGTVHARRNRSDRWTDAASFAIGDIGMLKKEIIGGLLAAGLLAELVPASFWSALFLHGHGTLGTIENALIGPIIAMVTCVCSVGNVPLAATLWHEGIGFAGVMAFIFADLLAAPLLVIYRRYFGMRLTIRIVVLLYLSIVIAALVVQGLFVAWHIAPRNRNIAAFSMHLSWDATTALDLAFLVLFGVAYVVDHFRDHDGGVRQIAIDPVCTMRVPIDSPGAIRTIDSVRYYFCSDHCADRFTPSKTDEHVG